MAYRSVDQLQKTLADQVFHYAKDAKKASGRAMGTLVEVVVFYLLASWGLEHSVAIEKSLAEYGNPEITHNVEYSLHPILRQHGFTLRQPRLPITAARVLSGIEGSQFPLVGFRRTLQSLLTSDGVLRHSCVVANGDRTSLVAVLDHKRADELQISISEQYLKPYAIFECKRVGVEEGNRKGPQTIEKAKQGAYVARTISSLQKVRMASGSLYGLIYKSGRDIYSRPYTELLAEIVASNAPELLQDFVLTVGVASNHGNWFTSDNHNKELKVLAQSYDWLLFLTDEGLSELITELLLEPPLPLIPAREAFLSSYTVEKKKNKFTKVQMALEADQALRAYFTGNLEKVEGWFNVIAPRDGSVQKLGLQISELRGKNWRAVHAL